MQIKPVSSEELGNHAYERVAPHIFLAVDRDNHESRVLFTLDDSENCFLVRKPWGLNLEEVISGLM